MKKILLSIKNFFLSLWRFFFGKAEVTPKEADHVTWSGNPVIPQHNNRGKHVQYVPMGNGKFRAIFHNA